MRTLPLDSMLRFPGMATLLAVLSLCVGWYELAATEMPRITGSTEIGENTFHSPYFGDYYAWPSDSEEFGWIYHPGLEWLCVAGRGEDGGFWAWDPAIGWMYFGSQWWDVRVEYGTWVFLATASQFIWYEPGTTAPAWFLSSDLTLWITDAPAPIELQTSALDLATFMDAVSATWEADHKLAVVRNEVRQGETMAITFSGSWTYSRATDFTFNSGFVWTIDTITVTSSKGTEVGTPESFSEQQQVSQPKELHVVFYYHSSTTGTSHYQIIYTDGQVAGPYDFEFGE